MKPSLQKLLKFFKLEADRGYDNHAVLGGLARMLDHWVPEARAEDLPEDLIQAIIYRLQDYARLTTKSREETLEGLIRRIKRTIPDFEIAKEPSISLKEAPPQQPVGQVSLQPDQPDHHESAPPELSEETRESTEEQVSISTRQEQETISAEPDEAQTVIEEPIDLDSPVTVLSGIGPRNSLNLARLGIHTLKDLLYYLPRRYDDYSKLKPINRLNYGEQVTVIGTIKNVNTRPIRGGKFQLTEAVITDGSGSLRVSWFNQPYLVRRLHNGMQISLSGKTDQYLGRLTMTNPDWEALEQEQLSTNRIVPVYRLTAQVAAKWLRRVMNQGVSGYAHRVNEFLPKWVIEKANLIDLPSALTQIHFPETEPDLERAQTRLSFDEIFTLQLGVMKQKRDWQNRNARIYEVDDNWMNHQLSRLPFTLTQAQLGVLDDIRSDLKSGKPMNRLVQGDVGSGKTIIAAIGIGMVVQTGAQAAFMAPTGILAEQHYKNLQSLLANSPDDNTLAGSDEVPPPAAILKPEQVCLLVGSTPEAEKEQIRIGLQKGEIKLIIGTHALIEDPVIFSDLQMIVVDEQHRFGVEQRALLRNKGDDAHLLVMTATPIPRTLALTIYGDLDLSIIDELPAGRQPVRTHVLLPTSRERAHSLIRSQVEAGHQAFIIYPLVEESENSEAKAATGEYSYLKEEVFPDLNIALLHGRMKAEEKDQIMRDFRDGKNQILVATSVIEVGVDVPNATVMLIEGANRFGLAQLHQFRGRVGRGSEQAYCLLIPDSSEKIENERLQALVETNDGFVLAEKDLAQRGPGQFLGTRQSGFSEFHLANFTKIEVIEKARRLAHELIELDPDLVKPEHQNLAQAVKTSWTPSQADIS